MPKKSKKNKEQPPKRMDRSRRQARTSQIIFLALTVIILLSMVLSLAINR
jgi:hypothetical protein